MALNLNASPYYDDFSEAKNFHRVLFKPGVAVQARELTQLQTLLQNQLDKGFSFLVQEGAVITGCAEHIEHVPFIKLNDTDASAATIDNATLVNYVGDTLTGGTTGLTAEILKSETGTVAGAPDMKTFYLKYTNGGTSGTENNFGAGETLTVSSSDSGRNGDTFVTNSSTSSSLESGNYYGTAARVKIDPGLIYARGTFIQSTALEVYVDRYSKVVRKIIGFTITETAVSSADDTSLLDPASGSFNYNAPGADRYKLVVGLSSITPAASKPENFYQYLVWENGAIQRSIVKENPLSGVGEVLANRTYDESGNYVVKGLKTNIREHLQNAANTNGGLYTAANGGSNNGLVIGIEPGVGYVGGYKRELFASKRINILKSRQNVVKEDVPLNTSVGNYVEIDYVKGIWDIDGGGIVDLYDTLQAGNAAAQGNKVGTAKARHIVYSSGTPGANAAIYRLYLYDVKMQSGNFNAVEGFRFENTTSTGIADIQTAGGASADIKESKVNKFIWRLPYKNIKTIQNSGYDYAFTYTKEFDTSLAADGTVTISVTGDETFAYGATPGSITSDTIKSNIIMIATDTWTQDSVTIADGQWADLRTSGDSGDCWGGGASASITAASSTSLTFDTGGNITGSNRGVRIYINVVRQDTAPQAKTLNASRYVKIDTGGHPAGTTGTYDLGLSDVYKIESVTAGSDASYVTGQTDVTSDFRLNNGQTDNYYGHSKLIKKSSSSLDIATNRYIVVKLSYFSHTNSGASFFVGDSYPVDDTTDVFRTENIPVYRSATQGDFDLRDCIDFRPAMANTAADSNTLGGATENPSEVETINRPSGGLTNPVPVKTFTTDLAYYQGKALRVICDLDGAFRIVEGPWSDNPKLPPAPDDSMTLATVQLPPYPCLSTQAALLAGRPDYGISVKQVDNRRYTMKDISTLDQRISNLEYYASLNLLETYAKDQTIVDSSGTDRFKNGILVDPFTGHNVGSVLDPDYKIAVDTDLHHARPFFSMENISLSMASANANLVQTGPLITLPFDAVPYVSQLQASQTENLVKELSFTYIGEISLSPNIDNFVDTTVQPAVQVNFDGNYDAWEHMANAWGTQWGSWENNGVANVTRDDQELSTFSTGAEGTGSNSVFTTVTTEQRQTREGIKTHVTPGTQTQTLGERVVDTNIAPFMRQISVTFQGTRLKPSTRVYPFFDGENVTANVTNSSGTLGGSLITDANGAVSGTFLIPASTFRTGAKLFKLTNSSINQKSQEKTFATALYESSGLQQVKQDTIVSLKTANVTTSMQSEDRTVTDNNVEVTIGTGTPLPPAPAPVIIPNPVNVPVPVPVPVEVPVEVIVYVDRPADPAPVPVTTPAPVPSDPPVPVVIPVPDPVVPVIPDTPPATPPPAAPPPATVQIIEIPEPTWPLDVNVDFTGWWEMDGQGRFGTMDPLAQTFYVQGLEGGMFVPGIDLYFKTKSATTNGITLELREVINGVPGRKVLPYGSCYKAPGDISISTESGGTTTYNKTSFGFEAPVYLQNNTEYCIVPKPENDDDGYDLWISELGENKFGTTERIDKQPAAGMMFSSANDRTWSPHQAKDFMFTIYRCLFTKESEKSSNFTAENLDWITIDPTTWNTATKFTPGTYINSFDFTITEAGTGYASAPTVTASGGGGTGLALTATVSGNAITGFVVSNPGSGYTSAPTLTIGAPSSGNQGAATVILNRGLVKEYNDLYKYATVHRTDNSFDVGDVVGSPDGYGTIQTVNNKVINEFALNANLIKPVGTTIVPKIALTNTGAAAFNNSTFQNIDFQKTEPLTREKSLLSYSNEQDLGTPGKTATVNIMMKTDRNNASPVLDIDQLDLLCIKNEVNNVTTNETGRTGGDALSRYISRRVILEDGQDAEDLIVYLDADIPATAGLTVYAKLLNAADEDDFQEDLRWIALDARTTPDDTTEASTFGEYSYKIPDKGANAEGLNGSTPSVYQYDLSVVNTLAPTAGGSGYTSTPTVTISGGGGFGATATASISGGAVTALTVTNPGRDFTSKPTITITGGGGSSAACAAAGVTLGTVTHTGFKSYAIKIVPTTSNTCEVPKFKNVRAIALQA